MRAVVFDEFGEPANVLRLEPRDPPRPAAGQVRVRMLASPVNPSDLMTVRGIYGQRPALPATPGYEGVGVVEESNAGLLGKFLLGKRVAVLNRAGGNWAEQVVIPAKQAIPLSPRLPVEQAAMFFVNPATAYVMTRRVLAVPKGQWLLQTAAGSALGRMVIRLGQKYGFRTLNVVRRAEQAAELKAAGGDEAIAFDPPREPPEALRDAVRQITGGHGVRYAIDPVGGAAASAVVGCLGDDARLLLYGTLSDEPFVVSSRALMTHSARVEGFWLSRYMNDVGLVGKLKLVRTLQRLIQAGVLASDVGQSFPLERIAEAVTEAERPGRGGKVLVRIGPDV